MRFTSTLLAAFAGCIVTNATPVDPKPVTPDFWFSQNGVVNETRIHWDLVTAGKDINSKRNDPGAVTMHRRDMAPNKQYAIAGWVVTVGGYIVEAFGGTSWAFPTDGPSVGYIADQVASSLLRTIGNGETTQNVGGGWTWHGQIYQSNYEFNEIPYSLMYSLVYDAIRGASDWLTWDNAFDFIIHDANRVAILELQVYPTNTNGQFIAWHDEP